MLNGILAAAALLFPGHLAFGLTDEMNRPVSILGTPRRIISLAPSITEILFVVGAGERVVGVSQNSDFPEAARKLLSVGPYYRPNLESIITLQPDLVIATVDGTPRVLVDELDRLGIPTFAINPTSVEQLISSIRNIGIAVRAPDTERVARQMEAALACIQDTVKKVPHHPKVLFQIDFNPLVSAGKGTFSDSIITLAGGINIARRLNGKYPRLSMEQVIVQGPEVIIVSIMEKAATHVSPMDYWRRWAQIPAVREGRVYTVESDLVDRPSPRCIRGILAIVPMLHPPLTEEVQRCKP
jgi:iron complex transport system substrate-binding protein